MLQVVIRFLEFILAKAKMSATVPQTNVTEIACEADGESTAMTTGLSARRAATSRRAPQTRPPRSNTRALTVWRSRPLLTSLISPSLELPMEGYQPPEGVDPIDWSLEQAKLRLTQTEFLLLEPDPEAIQQATFHVNEVGALVQRAVRIFGGNASPVSRVPYVATVLDLHRRLKRVRTLLEGAKRMQWARIRWIGSIVQTYTASGKARLWNPAARTWTCEM
jgi:hypothetical protein